MIILSHRGFWDLASEKNSMRAFERSFACGFGIETDIRDRGSRLVISHDMALEGCIPVEDLFELYNRMRMNCAKLTMALNIKADGLNAELKGVLKYFGITDYFVFDMSIPQTLAYLNDGCTVFIRQSEIEPLSPLYNRADGVWVDCFFEDWVESSTIREHLDADKKVCLVSPELHKRSYEEFWQRLKYSNVIGSDNVMLCTDHPGRAKDFFYE